MDKTTVLIADDHPLLRDGLTLLLQKEPDFEVVGQASDGEEAVKLAGEKAPDIVLMDIEMPRLDGLEATRRIKAEHPETSVLVLTVHDDEEYISAFLEAGAAGYLLKTTYGKELVQALRAVHMGVFVLDTQIGPRVFSAFSIRPNKVVPLKTGQGLTADEMKVAKLVGQGMTNDEIARRLNVSMRSVKGRLSDIFYKLGVSSRTEATTACLRTGIISIDELC
jgi:DNA-binding NarL/FixJ family response regulator